MDLLETTTTRQNIPRTIRYITPSRSCLVPSPVPGSYDRNLRVIWPHPPMAPLR